MSYTFDDLDVGGQLRIGTGLCPSLGEGDKKIDGSAFIEGPMVVGAAGHFPTPYATLMVGPNLNVDPDNNPTSIPGTLCQGLSPPYSLAVSSNAAVMGNLDVNFRIQAGGLIVAGMDVVSKCGRHWLSAKKDFDIEHPTKEGMRLHHGSLEGPEHGVYIRGRNKGSVIELPEYWLGLVDESTITVQLTAIGEPQNLCVTDIKDNKVYVKGVEYFYFVQAERKDIEKFEVEYAG